ncbi:hypothetical protein D9M71_362640 [compost metagenome]
MAGGLPVLPGPIGSRPFGVAEGAGFPAGHLQLAFGVALQQAHLGVLPAVQVLAGSLEYGLAVGGYRQAARQVEQLAGLRLGLAQRLQLATLARGQVAGERSHQQKEHQGQHVFFALDGEREVGRYEQEVIGQERQRGASQRRSQATAHCDQQHRRQEHQRDIGQRQHTGHRPGQTRSHHGGQQRQQVMTPHPHPPHG